MPLSSYSTTGSSELLDWTNQSGNNRLHTIVVGQPNQRITQMEGTHQ